VYGFRDAKDGVTAFCPSVSRVEGYHNSLPDFPGALLSKGGSHVVFRLDKRLATASFP
jgi:hypothetical protein